MFLVPALVAGGDAALGTLGLEVWLASMGPHGQIEIHSVLALELAGRFCGAESDETCRRPIASIAIRDIDLDGSLEALLVVTSDGYPEAGIGGANFRDVFVLRLEPALSVQLRLTTVLDHGAISDRPAAIGTLVETDLDTDGRPDFLFRRRRCAVAGPDDEARRCTPEEFQLIYDEATDRYSFHGGVPDSVHPSYRAAALTP